MLVLQLHESAILNRRPLTTNCTVNIAQCRCNLKSMCKTICHHGALILKKWVLYIYHFCNFRLLKLELDTLKSNVVLNSFEVMCC